MTPQHCKGIDAILYVVIDCNSQQLYKLMKKFTLSAIYGKSVTLKKSSYSDKLTDEIDERKPNSIC